MRPIVRLNIVTKDKTPWSVLLTEDLVVCVSLSSCESLSFTANPGEEKFLLVEYLYPLAIDEKTLIELSELAKSLLGIDVYCQTCFRERVTEKKPCPRCFGVRT